MVHLNIQYANYDFILIPTGFALIILLIGLPLLIFTEFSFYPCILFIIISFIVACVVLLVVLIDYKDIVSCHAFDIISNITAQQLNSYTHDKNVTRLSKRLINEIVDSKPLSYLYFFSFKPPECVASPALKAFREKQALAKMIDDEPDECNGL